MVSVLVRRLRGITISIGIWGVIGAVLGAGAGLWMTYGSRGTMIVFSRPGLPVGLPGFFALLGAIRGALNGLVFSLLVMLGERATDSGSKRAIACALTSSWCSPFDAPRVS